MIEYVKSTMLVVYGLGCNRFKDGVKERGVTLNRIRNKDAVHAVQVMCNTVDPSSMTYDIWKRLQDQELESTPFVRLVAEKVDAMVSRKEPVILLGHSYGGSVVSRVGMMLQDAEFLRIGTFGSIFVPPPEATGSLDIRHYLYTNDIAAVCHKEHKIPKHNNVVLLQPRYPRNPVFSHMDYDHLISQVARTGTLLSP